MVLLLSSVVSMGVFPLTSLSHWPQAWLLQGENAVSMMVSCHMWA